MNHFRVLSIVCLVLFSFNVARAKIATEWQLLKPEANYFAVVEQSNSLFQVSLFKIESGHFQERVGQRFFKLESQAKFFLTSRDYSPKSAFSEDFVLRVPVVGRAKGDSLWEVKYSWDLAWEQKFTDWVAAEFSKDFFSMHKIATDCADAMIALKWIFSRHHALPMGSTLAGSGVLFTQDSVKPEWLKLPTHALWHKDQRFRAALNYVTDYAYTHTLFRDSYPIAIGPATLGPGSHLVNLGGTSGHTRIVSRTDFTGSGVPITIVSSTVPKEIRALYEQVFLDPGQPQVESSGFLRYRWIEKVDGQWRMKLKELHPMYSLEQYAPDFKTEKENFALAVFRRIAPNFSPKLLLENAHQDLEGRFFSRDEVVKRGFDFCQVNDCDPLSQNYDDWSTPSRDKQILELINTLKGLYIQFIQIDAAIDPIFKQKWARSFFPWGGQDISLKQLEFLWQRSLPSTDPRVSIARRWVNGPEGLANETIAQITRLVAERKILVQNGAKNCENKICRWADEDFNQSETGLWDSQFFAFYNLHQRYCKEFTFINCSALVLKGLNSVELNILGEAKDIAEIITAAPFFSHHPKDNLESRWGNNWARDNAYIFPLDTHSINVKSSALAVLNYSTVVDLKTKEEIYSTSNGAVIITSPISPLAIELGPSLKLLDLNEFAVLDELIEDANISELKWLESDIFVYRRTSFIGLSSIVVAKVTAGKIIELLNQEERDGKYFDINGENFIYSVDIAKKHILYDFSKGEVSTIDVGTFALERCSPIKKLELFFTCSLFPDTNIPNPLETEFYLIGRQKSVIIKVPITGDYCFTQSRLDKKNSLLRYCYGATMNIQWFISSYDQDLNLIANHPLSEYPKVTLIGNACHILSSYQPTKEYYSYCDGKLTTYNYDNKFGIVLGSLGSEILLAKSTALAPIKLNYFFRNTLSQFEREFKIGNRQIAWLHSRVKTAQSRFNFFYNQNSQFEIWVGNINNNPSMIPRWSLSQKNAPNIYGNFRNVAIQIRERVVNRGQVVNTKNFWIWIDSEDI